MNEPCWWKEQLFSIYQDCRLWPGWQDIFNCHDEDDQKYFQMLDEIDGKKKILKRAYHG